MTKRARVIIACALTLAVVLFLPRACSTNDSSYVHLTNDGHIMILPGDRLQTSWVTVAQLDSELTRVKALKGTLLYSREAAAQDPSDTARKLFAHIVSFGLPIKLVTTPHPDANKPPTTPRDKTHP